MTYFEQYKRRKKLKIVSKNVCFILFFEKSVLEKENKSCVMMKTSSKRYTDVTTDVQKLKFALDFKYKKISVFCKINKKVVCVDVIFDIIMSTSKMFAVLN